MINTFIQQGINNLRSGHLKKAENAFHKALSINPKHPDALHLLGVSYSQQNQHKEAVRLIKKAIKVHPKFSVYYRNLGLALAKLGKNIESINAFKKAILYDNTDVESHNDLAVLYGREGRLKKAKQEYERAIRKDPNYAEAYSNLGNTLKEMGRLDEAVASYNKAVQVRPDYAEVYSSLGSVLQELGQLDEAVASHNKAIQIKPDYAEAYSNLGNTLKEMGRLDEAVASYNKAIHVSPNFAEAYNNRGLVLKELRQLDEAVKSYNKAIEIRSDYAEAYSNRGNILQELEQLDEAVMSYNKAIQYKIDNADAYNNRGNALKSLGLIVEAIGSYREAVRINPNHAVAQSNLLFCMQYGNDITNKKLYLAHKKWGDLQRKWLKTNKTEFINAKDCNKKLRIGFVSPSFKRHPVGFFIASLFENKSDDAEFVCFSDTNLDDMSEHIKQLSDEWIDIRSMTDNDVANMIRNKGVDIAIDLAGHSTQNRLLVFARKSAPIQVTWIGGLVGTTGLEAIDYIISDRFETPDWADELYTEKIIRMPDSYVCYSPPLYAPTIMPLPVEKNGFITFGCFNNPAKINKLVLEVWAIILKSVPNSRLFLKYKGINDHGNRQRILEFMQEHGIDISRLILEGKSQHRELLDQYNKVDIALDTFYYSGGLTTCEALWMGVPVIAMPGETFVSRHSLTYLSTVGVPEFVASDASEYIELAVKLASNKTLLSNFRATLRERMATSALCNGELFADNFSAEMRKIWHVWCGHIDIHH